MWFGGLSLDLQQGCLPGEVWNLSVNGEIEMQRKDYTLGGLAGLYAFFLLVYLRDDFCQTFQCPMNVWICFS